MARAGDEPDAMYGLAARAVRISADGLTYRFAMRPEARFHDGSRLTAHDVAFSLTTLKEKGHPIITQLLRDFAGAEATDDATRDRALRAEARARRAAVRRRPADLLARLLRASGRSTRSTLDVPLGSGPYKVGRFEAGPLHRIRAREGLVGRRSAGGARAATISTPCATNTIATATSASRASPPRAICSARSSPRASGRRATTFPAIKDGRVKRDVLPDDTPSGAQGWFINTRRDEIQGSEAARGADLRLRFRMDQQDHHVRLLRAHPFGVPELRHDGERQARRRTNWRCSSRSAARCRTRCSASRSCRRCPTARARTARCCGAASQLLQEAGFAIKDGKRVDAERRAALDRVPARRAVVPAAPHAVTSRTWRRSASTPDLRIVDPVQIPQRASTTSISTSPSSASASRRRRAIRCAPTSPRRPPALKGSQNLAGIADPAIDALIDRIIAAETRADADHRLPGARPRDPRRPLLDSALVQGVALDRLLGRVRPAADQAALCPRHPGNLVVRSATRRRRSKELDAGSCASVEAIRPED